MVTGLTIVSLFLGDALAVTGCLLAGWRSPFPLFVLMLLFHNAWAAGLTFVLVHFFPVEEGEHQAGEPGFDRWQARAFLSCLSCNYFDQFIPIFLKAQWYTLFGARLAPSARVAGRLLDCSLVEMGADSLVGFEALVTAHFQMGNRVRVAPVRLREGATVGLRAVVFPGVVLEEGAALGAGALATTGQRIGKGEIWAGVPARRLRTGHWPSEEATRTAGDEASVPGHLAEAEA